MWCWYLHSIFRICFHFLDWGAWHYFQLLSSLAHLLKSNNSMWTCWVPHWISVPHSLSKPTNIKNARRVFQLIIYNCNWLAAISIYKTGHKAKINLTKSLSGSLMRIKIQCWSTSAHDPLSFTSVFITGCPLSHFASLVFSFFPHFHL